MKTTTIAAGLLVLPMAIPRADVSVADTASGGGAAEAGRRS